MFTSFRCLVRVLVVLCLVLCGLRLLAQQPKAFVPTRFTVVDAGTVGKPDVILLPGLASSRAVWDGEAAKLAPNFRLHVLQVNGFAGQPAGVNAGSTDLLPGIVEELHAYIAATGMHPEVMGHSLGGTLTLMLIDTHPADVKRAVIVDALPFLTALYDPAATAESAKPIAAGMKAQVGAANDAQFSAFAEQSESKMVKSPEALKLVMASSMASDRGVFAEAMAEDMTTDLRADLPNMKTPVLLVYPYDATVQGPDVAKVDATYGDQYKAMPNAKLLRVDDSRHFIMYDQPVKFDAAVEAFLR